jgi:hypothetical protein
MLRDFGCDNISTLVERMDVDDSLWYQSVVYNK